MQYQTVWAFPEIMSSGQYETASIKSAEGTRAFIFIFKCHFHMTDMLLEALLENRIDLHSAIDFVAKFLK